MRLTDRDIHTHTHIHENNRLKCYFRTQETLKSANPSNRFFKNLTPKQWFLYHA